MDTMPEGEAAQRWGPEELRRMVGPDPKRPGPDRARLIEEGIPVWAIIGYVPAVGGDADPLDSAPATIAQVARVYGISPRAVVAALRYYAEHRAAIDIRL